MVGPLAAVRAAFGKKSADVAEEVRCGGAGGVGPVKVGFAQGAQRFGAAISESPPLADQRLAQAPPPSFRAHLVMAAAATRRHQGCLAALAGRRPPLPPAAQGDSAAGSYPSMLLPPCCLQEVKNVYVFKKGSRQVWSSLAVFHSNLAAQFVPRRAPTLHAPIFDRFTNRRPRHLPHLPRSGGKKEMKQLVSWRCWGPAWHAMPHVLPP